MTLNWRPEPGRRRRALSLISATWKGAARKCYCWPRATSLLDFRHRASTYSISPCWMQNFCCVEQRPAHLTCDVVKLFHPSSKILLHSKMWGTVYELVFVDTYLWKNLWHFTNYYHAGNYYSKAIIIHTYKFLDSLYRVNVLYLSWSVRQLSTTITVYTACVQANAIRLI